MNKKREHAVANLKALVERQKQLVQELEASLRIKDLWPECFDTGGCKEKIIGGPSSGYRFRITQNGDPQLCREWPLSDVPHEVIRNYLKRTNIVLAEDRNLTRALRKIAFIGA
jgi:hypothetical protein